MLIDSATVAHLPEVLAVRGEVAHTGISDPAVGHHDRLQALVLRQLRQLAVGCKRCDRFDDLIR